MTPTASTAPTLGNEFILLGPGGSRPFDGTVIEEEIRAMWRSAAADGPTRGHAVYRAALANLVVPLAAEDHGRLTPVLVEVARRHPSRLILVEMHPDPDRDPLRARVTALCHLRPAGGGVVCSEQIILSAGPGAERLVPSAIRSMLVGGLPFVLLDIGGDGSRAWIEDLQRGADLVLGDSGLHQRAAEEGALWRVIASEGTARVHDLAWARLTPWRELLAEQFDALDAAASLSTLEQVTIENEGSSAEPSPSAFLFAGWLSARLGWTPEGRDGDALVLRSGHGALRLHLRHDAPGATHLVSRVRLQARPPHPLDLEIVRRGRDARASLHLRRPREEQRLVAFHYRDFATCLVAEIHRHEPNPTLEAAAHSAEALRGCWRHVP